MLNKIGIVSLAIASCIFMTGCNQKSIHEAISETVEEVLEAVDSVQDAIEEVQDVADAIEENIDEIFDGQGEEFLHGSDSDENDRTDSTGNTDIINDSVEPASVLRSGQNHAPDLIYPDDVFDLLNRVSVVDPPETGDLNPCPPPIPQWPLGPQYPMRTVVGGTQKPPIPPNPFPLPPGIWPKKPFRVMNVMGPTDEKGTPSVDSNKFVDPGTEWYFSPSLTCWIPGDGDSGQEPTLGPDRDRTPFGLCRNEDGPRSPYDGGYSGHWDYCATDRVGRTIHWFGPDFDPVPISCNDNHDFDLGEMRDAVNKCAVSRPSNKIDWDGNFDLLFVSDESCYLYYDRDIVLHCGVVHETEAALLLPGWEPYTIPEDDVGSIINVHCLKSDIAPFYYMLAPYTPFWNLYNASMDGPSLLMDEDTDVDIMDFSWLRHEISYKANDDDGFCIDNPNCADQEDSNKKNRKKRRKRIWDHLFRGELTRMDPPISPVPQPQPPTPPHRPPNGGGSGQDGWFHA